MAKQSFWGGHLSWRQPEVEHEPTGSTISMVPHDYPLSGEAMYTVDYNCEENHLIVQDVPVRGMRRLLEELDLNDRQWIPKSQNT